MRPDTDLDDLLSKYLFGHATPNERLVVDRWLADSDEHRAILEQLRAGVSAVGPVPLSPFDLDALTKRILTQDRTSVRGGRLVLRQPYHIPSRRWVWGAGAILLLVAAFLFRGAGGSHPAGVTRTYATSGDREATFTLDDGTQVLLAPHTTMRVHAFSAQSRTVLLDSGDAYFDVKHIAGAPFEVRSGTTTTHVLGTSFLVRHRANDGRVRVAVADGKVRVTSSSTIVPEITLTAGRVAEFTDSTAHTDASEDVRTEVEREQGRLVFYRTPVSAVLSSISQWYGYQFHCVDSTLLQRPVNIAVSMKSSAAALAKLELILGVNVTVIGDTVTLTPRLGRPPSGITRKRGYDMWIPNREAGR